MPFRQCQCCNRRFISASGRASLCTKCRVKASSLVSSSKAKEVKGKSSEDSGCPSDEILINASVHDQSVTMNPEAECITVAELSNEACRERHDRISASHETSERCVSISNKVDFDDSDSGTPKCCLAKVCIEDRDLSEEISAFPSDSLMQPENENLELVKLKSIPSDALHDVGNDINKSLSKSSYECLICGNSLLHLQSVKGRINHIKRCGKKHTVGVSDVIFNDYEDFVEINEPDVFFGATQGKVKVSEKSNDKNSRQIKSNSAQPLNVVQLNETEIHINSPGKQSVLTTFFKRPKRSMNDVLLQGAKCIAKSEQIITQNKGRMQQKSFSEYKGRRQFKKGNNSTSFSKSCPAYKKISGTDIIVDGFYYAHTSLSRNYVLTHFHADHYGGITKSWNSGTIYCSVSTATLVSEQLGVDTKYLHPININIPTVIESCGKPVTMLFLDANHCPGAVMALFRINTRSVLHVGDFRWNNALMMKMPEIRQFATLHYRLDELYLDTTYCDPRYKLPSQEDAIREVIKLIESDFKNYKRKKILILVGSYTIGKEKIYMSIAKHFGLKIYVDGRRQRILSALNLSSDEIRLLTCSRQEASCAVIPMGHLNFKKMLEYENAFSSVKVFSSGYDRILAIRPTGWSLSKGESEIVGVRTSGKYSIYSGESSSANFIKKCMKPC